MKGCIYDTNGDGDCQYHNERTGHPNGCPAYEKWYEKFESFEPVVRAALPEVREMKDRNERGALAGRIRDTVKLMEHLADVAELEWSMNMEGATW